MKWKSALNAQGSRLIIVVLQVWMQALKKKERQGETQFSTKNEVPQALNGNVFFFFLGWISPYLWSNSGF
jgi:hypothetical protein